MTYYAGYTPPPPDTKPPTKEQLCKLLDLIETLEHTHTLGSEQISVEIVQSATVAGVFLSALLNELRHLAKLEKEYYDLPN